jgi:hypothetical protein
MGYFPQMIISSISAIILLLILAVREFDIIGVQAEAEHNRTIRLPSTSSHPSIGYRSRPIHIFTGSRDSTSCSSSPTPYSRPPRPPNSESSPAEVVEWERYRMSRHLAGQFVFPPVPTDQPQTSSQTTIKPIHRRTRTMMRITDHIGNDD